MSPAGSSGGARPARPFHHTRNDSSGSLAGALSPLNVAASQHTTPPYSCNVSELTCWPARRPNSSAVAVNFATANDTAKAGEDYVASAGTISFAPGETSKTIAISVKGDRRNEADERFFVNLSGASGGLIVDGIGIGTIIDDD